MLKWFFDQNIFDFVLGKGESLNDRNTPESVPVGVMATMIRTVLKHDRNRNSTIYPYLPLLPELTPQQLPAMERPSSGLLDKIDDFYDDLIDDGLISKEKRPEPRRRSRSRSDSRERRGRERRSRSRDRRRSPPRGGQFGGGNNLDKMEMMKNMMAGMLANRNSGGGGKGGGKNQWDSPSMERSWDGGDGGVPDPQKVIQAAKLISAMKGKGNNNW